jgi:hypothetical protein
MRQAVPACRDCTVFKIDPMSLSFILRDNYLDIKEMRITVFKFGAVSPAAVAVGAGKHL